MAIDRKLDEWQAIGLIDSETADRLRSHEASGRRPRLLWAVAGLGIFAITLGILLLVAANWNQIPDLLKVAVHLALLVAAATTAWRNLEQGHIWRSETALLILSALTLGGLSLHAQIYQLSGPLWQLLVPWLLLAGPALLLAGRTRMAGGAFATQLLLAMLFLAFDEPDGRGWWLQAHGAAIAAPLLLILLSLPSRPFAGPVRLALRDAGILSLLVAASFAHLGWAVEITASDAIDNMQRLILPLLVMGLALLLARRTKGLPRPLVAPLLLGPAIAAVLAFAIPHPDEAALRLVGVLIYFAMWGWIARGAIMAGWSALFAASIAALGIRIFIIYWELFGSLAATGGGLVMGGLLLVGLAWLWRRIVAKAGVKL